MGGNITPIGDLVYIVELNNTVASKLPGSINRFYAGVEALNTKSDSTVAFLAAYQIMGPKEKVRVGNIELILGVAGLSQDEVEALLKKVFPGATYRVGFDLSDKIGISSDGGFDTASLAAALKGT